MLELEDIKKLKQLYAETQAPLQVEMKNIKEDISEIKDEIQTQRKQLTSVIRHASEFLGSTKNRLGNVEKQQDKAEKRAWVMILAVATLGISELVRRWIL